MRSLLVTFDVEELDGLSPDALSGSSTGPSAEGTEAILPLLERIAVRATFFCTAHFARRHPGLVRSIGERGHELGSHGWEHADDYGRLAPAVAVVRLQNARRLLEDVSGREVRGVRTPRLAACPARVLVDAGHAYDASPHPTWVRHGLRGLGTARRPWDDEGLVRVPISVVPGLRLPVAWYVFRFAGALPTCALARVAGAGTPYVQLYFHPWEAADGRLLFGRRPIGWRTGPAWLRRLEVLLQRLSGNYPSATVGEAVAEWSSRRSAVPAERLR